LIILLYSHNTQTTLTQAFNLFVNSIAGESYGHGSEYGHPEMQRKL